MSTQNMSMISKGTGIRAWKYDDLPMPEWIQDLAGSLQPNGTFSLETDNGQIRVHPGNVVIERGGNLWVRQGNEASTLMKSLQESKDATITNIGPGKVHQFGTSERLKRKAKTGRVDDQRNYPPPVGSRPTIEWIQLDRLSVDGAYQRSTDNEASRRLIAGIASKFDWRLCAPLVVSRRGDHELVIIDGQH